MITMTNNSKTNILCTLNLVQVTGVDTDNLTQVIDQCATAVAGIDGGVGAVPFGFGCEGVDQPSAEDSSECR